MAETVAELQREISGLRRKIERLEAQLETQTAGGSSRVLRDGMIVHAKDGDGNDSAGVLRFIIVEDSDGNKYASLPIIG